jgi:nicotinate-nucleotide adenylyltransferase
MRVGILGGTFNPVHHGHLRAAEEARELLGLDKVLFIPAGTPPLKGVAMAKASQRVEMVRLATKGNDMFDVLDIEVTRKGPSYTIDTIKELDRLYHEDELVFILGADAFLELPKWKDSEDIFNLVDIAVVCRPGIKPESLAQVPYVKFDQEEMEAMNARVKSFASGRLLAHGEEAGKLYILNTTPLSISATEIRKCIMDNRSISYLLPEAVEYFIITNDLYAN